MNLEEIFTDSEELEVAKRILQAVPNDTGKFPFFDATRGGIVHNAYREDIPFFSGVEGIDDFLKGKEIYCRDHHIFFQMEQAKFIKIARYDEQGPLYIKSRGEA
jgi:hypothetical protein